MGGAAGLAIIRVASQEVTTVAGAVTAVAAFGDQVWAVEGTSLRRYDLDGAERGAPVAIGAGPGELIAAAAGPPAAVWTGATPGAWTEDGVSVAVPADRIVVPLTGRRWVTAAGARVALPSGLSCDLAPGSRALGGAITFDATAAVVLVERAGGRELVTIALANGRAQQRMPVPGSDLRIAARTGTTIVRVGTRELVAIDLRRGRVLAHHTLAYDLADLAIDPDGEQVLVRGEDAQLELIAVADLVTPRVAVARADEDEIAAPVHENVVATRAPVAIDPVAPVVVVAPLLDARAFVPRPEVELVERDAALAVLDAELRIVALRTLRAIAVGWDTRRLGYGNEGNHPFEHEVAALLGMNAGFAGDYVAASDAHLADALAAAPQRSLATPIGALAAELGLSPLAVDVLLAVAVPALWSEGARLYGILANDPSRPLVDEALLEQVLGARVSRHDLAAELDPRAPLVRLGVIDIDPRRPRPFAGLTVHPVVLARLRRELPDLGVGLTERGSDRALEELALAPGVLASAAAALGTPVSGPLRVVLRGRSGSGRRTLLAAFASAAHRALGVFDVTVLPRTERELVNAVRGGLRRAQLAGLVPCIVGLESIAFDDRSGRDVLREVVRAHPGPVAVVLPSGETAPFDAEHVAIDLPVLAESDRVAVWTRALADAGLVVGDVAALAARYRVGPGMIHRAITAVRGSITRGDDATTALDTFMRQARDARLGAYARRVERLASWDHVVLPGDIHDSLRELVSRVRHRRTVFEQWGMDRTMATSRGLTALFSGPPGTGKTLVAGVIARELGLDLYQVDLSKVMSKWIGETERNLAAIFDAAEDGHVVLLFDEADSLFAKRTEVRSSNDRYANLEVNYLLQRLDAFEGIAVLTTNARSAIDPAFKRRLSFRLSFPFPDEDTRAQLWRAHLPAELPIAGGLDLERLARKYQLSGGYIRNACLRAAFLAAQEASAVTQHHLERAVALEFAELGKLSSSGSLD